VRWRGSAIRLGASCFVSGGRGPGRRACIYQGKIDEKQRSRRPDGMGVQYGSDSRMAAGKVLSGTGVEVAVGNAEDRQKGRESDYRSLDHLVSASSPMETARGPVVVT